MTRPLGLLLLALALCAPAAQGAALEKPASPPSAREPALQLGVFEGTGRACGGHLRITPRRLSWTTPFSSCPASKFTLVERRPTGRGVQWVYQFKTPPKRCLYKAMALEKAIDEEGGVRWNASGFLSAKAYRTKTYGELNCYLVKLD